MVDARTFQALSDPTRLKILTLLGRGSMNVSAMVAKLDCTQPAVSRHLKVLKQAGLIVDSRHGKWIEYSSNPATVEEAAEYLRTLSEERERAGIAPTGQTGRVAAMTSGARAMKSDRPARAGRRAKVDREKTRRERAADGERGQGSDPAATGDVAAADAKGIADRDGIAASQVPERSSPQPETSQYVVERDEDFIDDLML